tara:strand:+ start:4373 stop:4825 length:453 start_codon:yes stop_codon:yes gene_type:complete
VSKLDQYVKPITKEAALEVAYNLRPDDLREVVEGHGLDPFLILPKVAQEGSAVYFTVPDGKTAGLAGVGDGGEIWMLCTPAIHRYPITFAREAKRWVDSRTEPLLWNIVDCRNTAHLKLLKFIGFKFLRKFNHGPNNLPFIEFCRVCTRP